jgi:hypothetical protein
MAVNFGFLDRNDRIWRNKYLTWDPNVRIYRSAVRPILTYSVDTRVDTSATELSETTEMKTLWKTVRKTRLDHVTSQNITQQCGIQPIREWILKRREE